MPGTKHCTFRNSLNHHCSPMILVWSSLPFYLWENGGSKKIRKLPAGGSHRTETLVLAIWAIAQTYRFAILPRVSWVVWGGLVQRCGGADPPFSNSFVFGGPSWRSHLGRVWEKSSTTGVWGEADGTFRVGSATPQCDVRWLPEALWTSCSVKWCHRVGAGSCHPHSRCLVRSKGLQTVALVSPWRNKESWQYPLPQCSTSFLLIVEAYNVPSFYDLDFIIVFK